MKAKSFRGRNVTMGMVRCIPCAQPVPVRRDLTMIPHGDCRGGNTSAHDGKVKASA